jgi:hypothetical protein
MAELTMDLGESLTALATALGMNLKIESLQYLNSPRLDELNLVPQLRKPSSRSTSNGETLVPAERQEETPVLSDRRGISLKVVGSAIEHSKRAITAWLEAYDDFPRVRRFMCMGRAGDRFAQALRKLDDSLVSL